MNLTCWIVTEDLIGTQNQCVGVAESLPQDYIGSLSIKTITLRQPWKLLSPYLGLETDVTFSPKLYQPYPDLLICAGRKAVSVAKYIKRKSRGKTFTVFLQNPRISPSHFDLVAMPAHDIKDTQDVADNVLITTASPNRITPEKIKDSANFIPFKESLSAINVAVLIGGNSKSYCLTPDIMQVLAEHLKSLDVGLMITTSRRTGQKNKEILRDVLKGTNAYIWDGTGENPYLSMLAYAQTIIVTCDSASMLSEACSTGKPVYMVDLEKRNPNKVERLESLHQNLIDQGSLKRFEGGIRYWACEPLNDAQKVADEIMKRLPAHLQKYA